MSSCTWKLLHGPRRPRHARPAAPVPAGSRDFLLIAYGIGQLRARAVAAAAAGAVAGGRLGAGAPVHLRPDRAVDAAGPPDGQRRHQRPARLHPRRGGAGLRQPRRRRRAPPVTARRRAAVVGYAQTVGYFAFFVLPTIIFFSMLTAIAYHVGVMQLVVQGLAWVMCKTMKTSGAETLSAAANIFVGQTEAPLLVSPFLAAATQLGADVRHGRRASPTSRRACWACTRLARSRYVAERRRAPRGGVLRVGAGVAAGGEAAGAGDETPQTVGRRASSRSSGSTPTSSTPPPAAPPRALTLAINVGAMLIAFTALVALVNALHRLGQPSSSHLTPGGRAAHAPAASSATPLAPLAWLAGVLVAGRAGGRLAAGRQDGPERAVRLLRDEGPLRRRTPPSSPRAPR